MAASDLTEIAAGDLPSGEHWILRAGGPVDDFGTFLQTIHPDGKRDEGGMRGPLLWPGSVMNVYTGGAESGPRRVVARADPRVALVRVQLASGARLELPPVATMPDPGLAFFATLLPRTAALASVTAVDADGQALESQNLAGHELAWQRFQRQAGCQLYEVHLGVLRLVVDQLVTSGAVPAHLDRGAAGGMTRGAGLAGVPAPPVGEQAERAGQLGALGGELVGGPGRPLGVGPGYQQPVAFKPLEAVGQDVRRDARDLTEQVVEPARPGQ
jgi:hypothetical protein